MSDDLNAYLKEAFNEFQATERVKSDDKVVVPGVQQDSNKGWVYKPGTLFGQDDDHRYALSEPGVQITASYYFVSFYFGIANKNEVGYRTIFQSAKYQYSLQKLLAVTLAYKKSDLSLDTSKSSVIYREGKNDVAQMPVPPFPAGLPVPVANMLIVNGYMVKLAQFLADSLNFERTGETAALQAYADVFSSLITLSVTYYDQGKSKADLKNAVQSLGDVLQKFINWKQADGWKEKDGWAFTISQKALNIRTWLPTVASDGDNWIIVVKYDLDRSMGSDDHIIINFAVDQKNLTVETVTGAVDLTLTSNKAQFAFNESTQDGKDIWDDWAQGFQGQFTGYTEDSRNFADIVVKTTKELIDLLG